MNRLFSYFLLPLITLLIVGCSDEQEPVNNSQQTATQSGGNTSNFGLRCSKNIAGMETITYLGLSEFENKPAVAIRTERQLIPTEVLNDPNASEELANFSPINLLLDNGESGMSYTWTPGAEGAMTSPLPESAYDPNDLETVQMMANMVHGDCEDWEAEAALLQPPTDGSNDVDMQEFINSMSGLDQ